MKSIVLILFVSFASICFAQKARLGGLEPSTLITTGDVVIASQLVSATNGAASTAAIIASNVTASAIGALPAFVTAPTVTGIVYAAVAPLATTQQVASVAAHASLTNNPHSVTPAQIGAIDATNHPPWITLNDIPAQPTGPVVSLVATNGTEFVTLEPGDVLTLWRTQVTGTNALLSQDFQGSNGNYPFSLNYALPFDDAGFIGMMENGVWSIYCDTGGSWTSSETNFPRTLISSDGGVGSALVTLLVETNLVATGLTSLDLSNLVSRADLAAATNALVQTYLATSNSWITANFSNQSISASMITTNGLTLTVTVGGNSIDPQATNLLWQALSSGLATKAPLAWGTRLPDGSANPDPSYMTFLSAPATMFGSGCAWSSYGTYAVLTTPGATAFAAGSNGVFRIGPDSTNYFGYATGGSVIVGAVSDSIQVSGGGTPEGYAEIVYAYYGGDFPTLWFAPSFSVDFSELSGVAWVDNLDGTATVTAPATALGGFFKATTSATYSSVFETTMPARFRKGVYGDTNAAPVLYNATITITSGGHTYRIPAQLAD